ncbi:TPA: fimbrial protein, partial [Enterobacter chuandaensis]|nr:fimbrial protein [Enterobacter chuandaensis]
SYVWSNSCWNGAGGGTQKQHINVGAVYIQRDLPVGSVITTQNVGSEIANSINCDYSGNYLLNWKYSYNGGVAISDNIYKTNLEGIGIRISTRGHNFTNPPYQEPIYQVAGLTSSPTQIDFIKTGDVKPGTMNAGTIAEYYISENGITLGTMTSVIMDAGNNFSQLACAVTTPNLNFTMGTIEVNTFGDTPGFVHPKTYSQNLGLNCDAKANINVTLSGSQNPDTSDKSVIKLSDQGGDVADGVGVQLLYNNSPLELNKMLNLKVSDGGLESLPLTARYYQTKNVVKPGSANATAIINITYQ